MKMTIHHDYRSNSTVRLYDIALNTLSDVAPEEKFTVRDLLKGLEWNRIDKYNRTCLGSMCFAYVQSTGNNIIEPLGKTPQNQQIYKKL